MIKLNSKQRLFEVMEKLDRTFKNKLNEEYFTTVEEAIKQFTHWFPELNIVYFSYNFTINITPKQADSYLIFKRDFNTEFFKDNYLLNKLNTMLTNTGFVLGEHTYDPKTVTITFKLLKK